MARYAVIGLGKFGWTVATILADNGMEVIAIDKDKDIVDDIISKVTSAICLDSTEEGPLRTLNLHEVDAVILGIGSNIQESILTAALLKKIGVGMIYAKVDNQLHGRILSLIGVQNIIFPEEIVGEQIARNLISKNVLEYISISSGHIVVELVAPREFIGKTLMELALPAKRNVNIIAIRYNYLTVTEAGDNVIQKRLNDMPGAGDVINEGDILILLGPKGNIDKLINDTSTMKDNT